MFNVPKAPYMYFFFDALYLLCGDVNLFPFFSFFSLHWFLFCISKRLFTLTGKNSVDTLKRYIKKISPLNISRWLFFEDKCENNIFHYTPSKSSSISGGLHVNLF